MHALQPFLFLFSSFISFNNGERNKGDAYETKKIIFGNEKLLKLESFKMFEIKIFTFTLKYLWLFRECSQPK